MLHDGRMKSFMHARQLIVVPRATQGHVLTLMRGPGNEAGLLCACYIERALYDPAYSLLNS